MAKTYVVKSGDCLSVIAYRELGNSSLWPKITRPNGVVIKSPYTIYTGETLWLPDSSESGGSGGSGGDSTAAVNNTNKPTNVFLGLMTDTNTLYASWTWDKTQTASYKVKWYYDTGDNVWFVGHDGTIEVDKDFPEDSRQSTYNIPSNAKNVRFRVKPISEKQTVNKTETDVWTAEWSTDLTYDCSQNPPSKPSTPSVEIEGFKLTAELDNLDDQLTEIEFQVVRDETVIFATGKAKLATANSVSYTCNVNGGSSYKVRCRSYRGSTVSEWSDFSNKVETIPSTPAGISICRASSATSVYLEWDSQPTAKTYEIEYTTKREYFDGSDSTNITTGIEQNHYEKTGLGSGQEYFFRVRAVNNQGESGWSDIVSVVVGKKPAAPTTWSSTTTVITGEVLTLYWVHNSEDNSKSKFSDLEIYFGSTRKTFTVESPETPETEQEHTHSFNVDTLPYPEGTKIKWRVRTAGVTMEYGDWSIERQVDIYAPATLEMHVTDSNNHDITTLESLPFKVTGIHGPRTQAPTGYHLTITSKTSYDTVDNTGLSKSVRIGDEVYSKYFDISTSLDVTISAGDVDLVNNADYTVVCVVSLNSGLTATASIDIQVRWTDAEYQPNAEIGFNRDTYSAYIKPYCKDNEGSLIDGILLSVYRREYDGRFVELIKDVNNVDNVFVVDPHPALDFARYRIVAKTADTGSISYYDVPGYPTQEKAAILQWNEAWSTFNVSEGDQLETQPWSGSLLRLPYNIDVSDSNNPDVSTISYIGRAHPVSYYGTQIGAISTWKMDIVKSDADTLYALRRLSNWMGDVYVREPSGSGYWAQVTVSFSQTHNKPVVPVTLSIKRVEGGV